MPIGCVPAVTKSTSNAIVGGPFHDPEGVCYHRHSSQASVWAAAPMKLPLLRGLRPQVFAPSSVCPFNRTMADLNDVCMVDICFMQENTGFGAENGFDLWQSVESITGTNAFITRNGECRCSSSSLPIADLPVPANLQTPPMGRL